MQKSRAVISKNDVTDGEPYTWRRVSTVRGQVSVSRVLGHTNIVTTQIYAKITTQKLDNDLTMFGNKLNASFGSVTP